MKAGHAMVGSLSSLVVQDVACKEHISQAGRAGFPMTQLWEGHARHLCAWNPLLRHDLSQRAKMQQDLASKVHADWS